MAQVPRMGKDPHPLVGASQLPSDLDAPVRGGVIHDDNVDVDTWLIQRGPNRSGKEVAVVVARHNNGHGGASRQRLWFEHRHHAANADLASSPWLRIAMGLAGLPTQVSPAGRSCSNTDPMPSTAFSPTTQRSRTELFMPR